MAKRKPACGERERRQGDRNLCGSVSHFSLSYLSTRFRSPCSGPLSLSNFFFSLSVSFFYVLAVSPFPSSSSHFFLFRYLHSRYPSVSLFFPFVIPLLALPLTLFLIFDILFLILLYLTRPSLSLVLTFSTLSSTCLDPLHSQIVSSQFLSINHFSYSFSLLSHPMAT